MCHCTPVWVTTAKLHLRKKRKKRKEKKRKKDGRKERKERKKRMKESGVATKTFTFNLKKANMTYKEITIREDGLQSGKEGTHGGGENF